MKRILLAGDTAWIREVQDKASRDPELRVVSVTQSIVDLVELFRNDGFDVALLYFPVSELSALLERTTVRPDRPVLAVLEQVDRKAFHYLIGRGVFPILRGSEIERVRALSISRQGDKPVAPGETPAGARDLALRKENLADDTRKVGVLKDRVLAFYAPKGGVGKTTTAAFLAHTAARKAGLKTALLDLDLSREGSDAARRFGFYAIARVRPKSSIAMWSILKEHHLLDWEVVREYTVEVEPNLHLISSPWQMEDAPFVTEDLVHRVVRVLLTYFDLVVIDLSDHLSPATRQGLLEADVVYLITTPTVDMVDITNVFVHSTASKIGLPLGKLRLVMNMLDKPPFPLDEAATRMGVPIFATLSFSPELSRIVRIPEAEKSRNVQAYLKAFEEFAARVLPEGALGKKEKGKGIALLRRLFGRKGVAL